MTAHSDAPTPRAPCSAKADHRPSLSVVRMMGLETAADILGKRVRLADALGIDARSLRNKLDAGRGISRGDLLLTANALQALGERALLHARKLLKEAGPAMATSAAFARCNCDACGNSGREPASKRDGSSAGVV